MTSVERRTRKKLNRDVAGSTIFSERRGNVAHVAEDADVRFHRFHRQWRGERNAFCRLDWRGKDCRMHKYVQIRERGLQNSFNIVHR